MDIYCIDTSSLIEMKDKYLMDVNAFKPLWTNMERLIKKDRLIASLEVRKEIEQGDDELKKWVSNKKKLFVKPDARQLYEQKAQKAFEEKFGKEINVELGGL